MINQWENTELTCEYQGLQIERLTCIDHGKKLLTVANIEKVCIQRTCGPNFRYSIT